jgi:type I restriction enzyme S subunit
MEFAGLQDPMCGNSLPDGWKLMRLGDVGRVRYGLGQPPEQSPDGVPMIRATNVKRGRLVSDGLIRIKREAVPESRNPYLAAGDIIVVRSGAYTGDVAMVTQEWAGSVAGYDLVLSCNGVVDSSYCASVLLSGPIQAFFHGERDRSAQPHLNRQQLESTVIPVPPIEEQRKIAAVLGLVKRAIEQQERLIALTTELKKALLRKLFTEGLRGEPQKQTEIGPVPESWEINRLGDHCLSTAFGPRFSSNLYAPNGNVVTLRTTDLDDDGNIDYREAPKARLEIEKFESHLLQRDDVVVSRSGTCGIAAVFEGNGMHVLPGAFLIRLRLAVRLRPQFLRYYINSPVGRPRIMKLAQGAIQKNISGTALKNFSVPVPRVEEQQEIEAHVKAIDQKLQIHTQKKLALGDLFRTLLLQLMMAQIRVHDLDLGEILPQAVAERSEEVALGANAGQR